MNDQSRPVDGAGAMAAPYSHELDLLAQVQTTTEQAAREFRAGCAVAARLEIMAAHRLLDRAFSGEAV